MPTKSVNITIETPFGDLQIYTDPAKQAKADRLFAKTPELMRKGYEKGTERFGKQILRIVRKSLTNGMPPLGSKVTWAPHSEATKKRYPDHPLLNLTGQYKRKIGFFKHKNRTYVGLPTGLTKIMYGGKEGRKTLNQVAILLEYGTMDWLPPRPLWQPAYEVAGAKEGLKKALILELRKQFRNNI